MSIAVNISVLTGIVSFLFWWFRKKQTENNFMRKLPVPLSSVPILGIALDFSSTKVILKNLVKYVDSCGDLVAASIGPIATFLVVADYKLLEFVLSSTKLTTKSREYDFFRPWLGTGLLTSDGQKWKTHRRILTPAFHFKILEQFVETFEACGNILIEKLGENLGKESFDVYPYVTLYALDVICESIMGINIKAQIDDNSDYVQSVRNMCRIIMERVVSVVQMHDLLFPLTKNYYTHKKALSILHKQSNDVITARRKELEKIIPSDTQNEQELYFKNKKAFLDILLQTKIDGKPISQQDTREEVDTFMFEGHDTTASALSFALFCLANNPEAQRKAFEEQKDIFQDRLDSASTYTDLQNMKYLELVIKETLRLYPSVPFYSRKVTEDIKYGDDIIPKDVTVVIFAFKIHRNPKYFENPDEFKPERFESGDGKLPYAYIPFSAGPRNCIGQKFAMLELKSILSKILRNYELLPAFPKHEPELLSETILKSANGVNISLKRRQ